MACVIADRVIADRVMVFNPNSCRWNHSYATGAVAFPCPCLSQRTETNTAQLNEYEQSASEAATGGGTQTPNNVVALSAFGGAAGPGSRTDLVSWGDGGTDGAMGGSDEGAMQLRPYNQRIELPSVEDSDWEGGRGSGRGGGGGGGTGGGGGSGDDDGIHDLDEDELTRDKVKKAASHVREC